jgi:REP element-mobilizing transposase RayT
MCGPGAGMCEGTRGEVRGFGAIENVPRRPREEEAGAIHHVYGRGIDRRALFVDDEDRLGYLALLERVVDKTGWRCLSYCLMDNHVHLMVETPEPNLGAGMQRLHGDFAREINRRHGRFGHVFQGRFGSKRLKTESHLRTTAASVLRPRTGCGAAIRRPREASRTRRGSTRRGCWSCSAASAETRGCATATLSGTAARDAARPRPGGLRAPQPRRRRPRRGAPPRCRSPR